MNRLNVYFPESDAVWEGGNQYLESLIANTKLALRFSRRQIFLNQESLVKTSKWRDSSRVVKIRHRNVSIQKSIQLPWFRDYTGNEFVQWIFDSQDLSHPEYFSVDEIKARRNQILGAIERNCVFYFSSRFQEQLFQKQYPKSKSVGVMRFTYHPSEISTSYEWGCQNCNQGNYFYLPNQWWIHKNHISTIRAFQEYRINGGRYHLVLTGNQSDFRWPNLKSEILDCIKDRSEGIHNLGFIEKANTNFLFTHCATVLQPSSSEGWSTSIEAAIRFNKFIVANSIEVHKEQIFSYPNISFFQSGLEFSMLEKLFEAEDFSRTREHISYKYREKRYRRDILSVIRNTERQFR
jgi:hypothetical protein